MSGYDNINNILLKEIADVLVSLLNYVFNLPISQGIFPNTMKIAEILPLFKGKDPSIINNYRLISLLITMSKILEKIVYNRLYSFLEKNNILFESQCDLSKNRLCQNAITQLTSDLLKSNELGLTTTAVFIDLTKAFATLDHEKLLKKLAQYGIRGITNDLFKTYLENRKLRVKCATVSSSTPCTGGSRLSHTAVKPDSCLAWIFCINYYLYNLTNLIQISTGKPDY